MLNNEQAARMWAQAFTILWRQLVGAERSE
jgi:hypothetical protein